MTATLSQPENAKDREQLSWTAHPAASRRKHAIAATGIIIALAAAAGVFGGSIWWAVAALILLVLALNRFLFASRFTIDSDGITAQYLLRKQHLAWNRVRRFLHDHHGGYLSTRARPSWTDAYRGVHLLFPDDRESILQRIQHEIRNHQSQPVADDDASVASRAVVTVGGQR